MKKLLLTLLLLINLAQLPIAFAATPISHQNLVAIVTLDNNLKPANSPGIVFGDKQITKPGEEAAFGNYLLQMLAGGLITLAAPVAIIIIAIAGLIAVVSHGNHGLMDKAKKALTYAVIGLVIIIFSWIIVRATISLVISTNSNQPSSTSGTTQPGAPAPGSGTLPGAGGGK